MIHEQRIILATGERITTIVHRATSHQFHILHDQGRTSGPYDLHDSRFPYVEEYNMYMARLQDTHTPEIDEATERLRNML